MISVPAKGIGVKADFRTCEEKSPDEKCEGPGRKSCWGLRLIRGKYLFAAFAAKTWKKAVPC